MSGRYQTESMNTKAQLEEQRRINAELLTQVMRAREECTLVAKDRDNFKQMLSGAERRIEEVERFASLSQGQAAHLNQRHLGVQSTLDDATRQVSELNEQLRSTQEKLRRSEDARTGAASEVCSLNTKVTQLQHQIDEHVRTSQSLVARDAYEAMRTQLEHEHSTRMQQVNEGRRRDRESSDAERLGLLQEIKRI